MGRYILRSEIFTILDSLAPSAGGEVQLIDAIKELNEIQKVVGCEFDSQRYDVGVSKRLRSNFVVGECLY
jgi:UTP--glucose-1-phosphate uridylyltransferase